MLLVTVQYLNLHHLRNQFEHIIMTESEIFWEENESVKVIIMKKISQNLFNNYYWHDFQLINFCLYEYFKLITVKSIILSNNIYFLSKHFKYKTHTQKYSEKKITITFIITLIDLLSEKQFIENRVHNDHSETEII